LNVLFYDICSMWRWLRNKLRKRRMRKILAELDMSVQEILEKSPYAYGHWQGEDGYRIYDVRFNDKYLYFAYSEFSAEYWIIEQYYLDNKDG